jgi:hypothetical protein
MSPLLAQSGHRDFRARYLLLTRSGQANPIVGLLQHFAAWEPPTDRAMTTKAYFLLEMIHRRRRLKISEAPVPPESNDGAQH